MPPVRTLVNPTVVKPQPEAAPQQSTAVATLPSWAMTAPTVPAMPTQSAGIYVGQLQPATGKRAALLQAGCADGDYYIDISGQLVPLKPLKFWLIKAELFYTRMDATGSIVQAAREKAAGLDEHVVCLIVVDVNGVPTPAKTDFRKASWSVAQAAVNGLQAAAEPDFPQHSDAHKVAAAFPVPFGRVLTTVSVEKRISKMSGKPYFASLGQTAPPSISQLTALGEAFKDAGFIELLEKAKAGFDGRVNQIAKLCPAA